METNENIIRKIKRVVLVADDEFINQEILREILQDNYEIVTADNGYETLEIMRTYSRPISLILLDVNMPEMGGIEVLGELAKDETLRKIPVIVATSEKSYEVECLKLGAVDFITKPYDMPEIIRARVNRAIELSEDRAVIKAVLRDQLTGAYSMDAFSEYAVKMDQYHPNQLMDVVVVNLRSFHLYNALYGHEAGDLILRTLAQLLKDGARKHDGIVARVQGDSFAMYLRHEVNYDDLANAIQEGLSKVHNVERRWVRIGIYHINDHSGFSPSFVEYAKRASDLVGPEENYYVYNMEQRQKALYEQRLLNERAKALEEEQFVVYFQPKYNITGKQPRLSSAEALIRWIHPELGFINPGVFIPLFENKGGIRALDRYVWEHAARQVKAWRDEFGYSIPVSVNVSRIDMLDPNIVDTMLEIVHNAGIEPKDLYLEATESAYTRDSDRILKVLKEFRSHGFKIEIDDFGSGYSSLNAITTLPFDVLKLDMVFVRQMDVNERARNMVRIISDIAKMLGVPLVAEGVETKEQVELLKAFGYDIIQGYYFSKPVPAAEFAEFIKKEIQ